MFGFSTGNGDCPGGKLEENCSDGEETSEPISAVLPDLGVSAGNNNCSVCKPMTCCVRM